MKVFLSFKRVFVIALTISIGISQVRAQEESSSSFDVGADIVSNYIWRGSKFGTGAQLQPWLEFSAGNFAVGSWGSFGSATDGVSIVSFSEADLYLSYSFDFGLSLGLTDYYYPGEGSNFTDLSTATGAHGFELNLGYELGGLAIGANYMLNEAGVAATAGGDMYFELGYSFDAVSLFVGGGDGWHTGDGSFALCNIGMTVSKEIAITELFSLPISGSVIYNPDKDQFYVVAAISF